jgi:hypothetical protein
VLKRVKRLGEEVRFRSSCAQRIPPRPPNYGSSSDPMTQNKAVSFEPTSEPEKAIDYLYQVRSNVNYRGKEQPLDWDLLHTATAEVLPHLPRSPPCRREGRTVDERDHGIQRPAKHPHLVPDRRGRGTEPAAPTRSAAARSTMAWVSAVVVARWL